MKATEKHHIVYEPKELCAFLCHQHHREITALNSRRVMDEGGDILDNQIRLEVYNKWQKSDSSIFHYSDNERKWMS